MIKEYTLGDCVDRIIDYRGKTPKKLGGDWTDKGVRVISALNVHGGFIDNEDQIRCVSKEIYEKWMQEDVEKYDCFLASEGASLGENSIWDTDEKVVLGQRLYAIRTNPDVLDPWFFAMYMQTKRFKDQIHQVSTGSTVFGISQTVLLSLKLLLPEIGEQRAIGQIYQSIRQKIINNNNIFNDLESMAKLLYDYWFIQYNFPDENGKPYKSSGGKMVWNEELKREIPDGWEIIPFGDFITFTKGKIPDELVDNATEKFNSPYITIDVANNGLPQYCRPEAMVQCNGETVMVMDGAASGDVYLGNEGSLGSTFSMVSSRRKDITNSLVYMLLKSNSSIYKRANTGSTVPHANRQFIEKMKLVLPKDANILSKQLDLIFEKVKQVRIENQQLTSLLDFLLPMLMNGQVKVRN